MRTFLGLIASLGLVACVGGIDTPPAGGDDDDGGVGGGGSGSAAVEAKRMFEQDVYPIVKGKCIGCHSSLGPAGNITGFVSPEVADSYITATGYQAVVGNWTPDGAPVLTIVTQQAHKGQSYAADEVTKITNWLNKELEARAGGGGGGPTGTETPAQLTQRLVNEWTGCMTLENFTAANMTAWGNVNAGGGGQCKTCHGLGEYGHIASNVDQPFFDIISQDKYYLAQYFSVDIPNKKVIVNTRSFTGVGERLPPHQAHPGFNPTENNGFAALEQFYTLTETAKAAAPGGVCGPSKLMN